MTYYKYQIISKAIQIMVTWCCQKKDRESQMILIKTQGILNDFYQQKNLLKDYRDTSWLIYHFLKIVVGYLLLTNGKNLSKFIEKETVEK